MNSKRLCYGLIGLLIVLSVAGIIGVIEGNAMLGEKSKDLVDLKVENMSLSKQQAELAKAKKDVARYTDLKNIVKAVVPQEKDQARTVREIIQIANDSKVSIASINFPSSNLGQAAPKATKTDDEDGAIKTSTTTTAKTPATTQVKAVEGISGVYQMEIVVQSGSSVSYNGLINFLKRLEQNRRTAQVTSLTIQPGSQDRNQLTFGLTLAVYIKP